MNRSWTAFGIVVVAGVAADQWAKAWAEVHVRVAGVVTAIPGFVDFRFVRNPGALFSLGGSIEPNLRRAIFSVTSALVITLIAVVHARTPADQGRARVALSLLAAGAAGNLIDRVRTGEVVDFIHVQIGPVLRWATFNLADVFISAGLLLLAMDIVLRPQPESLASAHHAASAARVHSASDGEAKT